MFEQFGSDSSKQNLELNNLLPSANQSEVSHSFLSTLFQRWTTKPEIEQVSGFVGTRSGDQTKRIVGETVDSHLNQIAPTFYWQVADNEYQTMSHQELLSRAEFTGVRVDRYVDWGTLTQAVWNPPVDFDKLINWNMYFWVDRLDVFGNPDYITITRGAHYNDWSRSNKWYHVNDMQPEDYSYARQAIYPIIEFDDVKLSRWVKVSRVWLKNGVETSTQPTISEIWASDNSFSDQWVLLSETLGPVDDQELIDTDPSTEIFRNPAELPRYVGGTNSVRVYYVTTNDDGTLAYVRTYDFVEIPDPNYHYPYSNIFIGTSIKLLTPPPPDGVELRIYVGASTPSDRLLDYVDVKYPTGYIVPANLCIYRYIDQPKTKNNNLPLFNLYDAVGEFKTVGHIWKFREDPTADYNEILNMRISQFRNTEEFAFETDLFVPTVGLYLYYNNTDNLHYSIWKGTTKYVPTQLNREGKPPTQVTELVSWDLGPMLTNNPRRETPTDYLLSELAPHLKSVTGGGKPTITVTNSGEVAFISSLIAPNLSATNIIDFVLEQRQTNISILNDRIFGAFVSILLEPVRVVDETKRTYQNVKTIDLPNRIYDLVKQQSLNISDTNQAFVDTFSYNPDTNVGFPHILPSPAQLKWCAAVRPSLSTVTKNNITRYRITTHDSFLTNIVVGTQLKQPSVDIIVSALQIEQLVRSLSVVTAASTLPPTPQSNGSLWNKIQIQQLYRFEVTVFGGVRPTFDQAQSISWYDTETCLVYERVDNVWVNSNILNYWVPVEFDYIVAHVLLLIEEDMYMRAIEITQPVNDYSSILKTTQRNTDLADYINQSYTFFKYKTQAKAPQTRDVDLEYLWNSSYDQLRSELVGMYSIDPIEFWRLLTQNTTSPVRLSVKTAECLNVNSSTNDLYNQRVSEIVETYNANFSLIDMFIKYNKLDSKKDSPLRIWSSWTTRLAFQTDTIIIPESLQISHQCELIEQRSVVLDKVERAIEIEFSNLIISLSQPGHDMDLPNGVGTGWWFRLSCSGPFRYNKKRFNIRKQTILWNPTVQTYETVNGEILNWQSGDAITFVIPESSVPRSYYIRRLTDTKFELADTHEIALDYLGTSIIVNIGISRVDIQTLDRTFYTFASNPNIRRAWAVPAVDDSITTFNFPVVVQGIQGIIDFFTGYTKYMDVQGLRINAGEVPYTDEDMGVVTSWEQQLIKGIEKLYTTRGLSNRNFNELGQNPNRVQYGQTRIELNPFPQGVWFETPRGVLCDLYNTPYADDLLSYPAIYDDRNNPIIDGLTPLRSDRINSIFFTPLDSTYRTINSDTTLAKQHIAAGKISIDMYRHIIVFEDRTSDNMMLFNRVANLKLGSFDVEYVKAKTHFYRPACNGYVVTPTEVIPNFSTIIDQQRNDCNVTATNEHVETTQQFRRSLGKYDSDAFKLIPTTDKTEYQFWQRLIRAKGTVEAIDRFNKHELIGTADVDQHWAYKLGTFGAVPTRKQYEFWLTGDDTLRENTTFTFDPSDLSNVTRFPVTYVGLDTESKWVNFFDTVEQLNNDRVIKLPATTVGDQPFFLHFSDPSVVVKSNRLVTGLFEHSLKCDIVDINLEIYDIVQQYIVVTKKSSTTVFFVDFVYPGEVDSVTSRIFVTVDGIITRPKFTAGNSVTFNSKLPFGAVVALIWVSNRQTYHRSVSTVTNIGVVTNVVNLYNPTTTDGCQLSYIEYNNQIIEITSFTLPKTGQCCVVRIDGIRPDYGILSPVRVADSISTKIIKQIPAWDPRKGIHTPAYDQVDVESPLDPASYTVDRTSEIRTVQFWSSPQVGQYWWNTENTWYKPYDDTLRYSYVDLSRYKPYDISIETWGQLFDGQSIQIYEWVRSTEKPSVSITSGTAYSRLLTKTRNSNIIKTFVTEQNETTFTTVSPLLFNNGDTVAIYAPRDITNPIITGAEFGEEYILVKLSDTEFMLLNPITPINVVDLSLDSYVADTNWDNYQYTEITPFVQQTQVASIPKQIRGSDLTIVPLQPIDSKYDEYIDSNPKVWVNGIAAGMFVDPNLRFIRIIDDETGIDWILTDNDEVTILFTIDEANISASVSPTDSELTIFVRDYPYTQLKQMFGVELVDYYYYWVRGIFDVVPTSKQQTTYATEYGLTYPADGNFMTANHVRGSTQSSSVVEYRVINVRGLHDIRNPTLNTMCINIDPNLRAEYSTSKKVEHEKWVLFRERQRGLVPTPLLNIAKKTLLGVDYTVDPPVIVPNVARTLYDYCNLKHTRFGTGPEQVLCDTEDARMLLRDVITDVTDLNYMSEVDSLVTNIDYTDAQRAKLEIDHLFASTNPLVINKFILRVVKFGLFKGYEYEDIFKTSYITVSASQRLIGTQST